MKDLPSSWRPAEQRVVAFLVRHDIPPDAITWISLAVSGFAAMAFALGHLFTGAVLFLTSGGLDLFDGRVARATRTAGPRGALLDSVCDRYAELMVYSGLVVHFRAHAAALALTLAALGGSFLVSYARARAEGLGVSGADVGLAPRPERIIAICVGGLASPLFGNVVLELALLLIAVAANATAIARVRHARRALVARVPGAPRVHTPPPTPADAPAAPASAVSPLAAATSSRPLPG